VDVVGAAKGHSDEEGRDSLADADRERNTGDEHRGTDGPENERLVRIRP
jgi:hypothetical protein